MAQDWAPAEMETHTLADELLACLRDAGYRNQGPHQISHRGFWRNLDIVLVSVVCYPQLKRLGRLSCHGAGWANNGHAPMACAVPRRSSGVQGERARWGSGLRQ